MPLSSALVEVLGLRPCRKVARAELEALKQRAPYLYAILGINVIALAYTHTGVAPFWQVVLLPGSIVLLCIVRSVIWVRLRPDCLSHDQVQRFLRATGVIGSAVAFLILLWAMTLDGSDVLPAPAGMMTTRGHAIFFVEITYVSCIFMMMHNRFATTMVSLTVSLPFAGILFANGTFIESVLAMNVLLVAIGMLCVAITFSRHFEQSVIAASDLLRLSAESARLASSDALTSLPNRRQFFRELEAASAASVAVAVITCDLDGFKQINDVYGHQAGDDVLRQIATRLRAVAPPGCCVARMGGDEFTCLLIGEDSRAARRVAEQFIAACAEPIVGREFTAQLGASAGVCHVAAIHATGSMAVYDRADFALLEAKRVGRGRVELFTAALDRSMRRESSIAHHLLGGNLENELSLAFQPIVDAGSFDIRAFEGLVRWTSPTLGFVSPEEFIPIAERTDLIFKVSRLVLRIGLAQATQWPEQIRLKINLSVRDLMSETQTVALLNELGRSSIVPDRVTFEITETILAESLEQIRANVDLIRTAGCKIAIDDFGVGYSSLNYIHMLAPDVIKIDRCFIGMITANETTRRVVRTIIDLARNIGARSIAEGVETLAQARLLAEFGCDELQGFYFSRPVSADESVRLAGSGAPVASELDVRPVPVT